jgi:hypothetical protein
MITWGNVSIASPKIPAVADLVLRKLWLLASPNKSNEVGFPKHLYRPYSGVEIYPVQRAQTGRGRGIYLERLAAGMVLN